METKVDFIKINPLHAVHQAKEKIPSSVKAADFDTIICINKKVW